MAIIIVLNVNIMILMILIIIIITITPHPPPGLHLPGAVRQRPLQEPQEGAEPRQGGGGGWPLLPAAPLPPLLPPASLPCLSPPCQQGGQGERDWHQETGLYTGVRETELRKVSITNFENV